MVTETLAKMNVPLTVSDVMSKTMKIAFPDSAIAKNYSCSRNKTTAIINHIAESEQKTLKKIIAIIVLTIFLLLWCACFIYDIHVYVRKVC